MGALTAKSPADIVGSILGNNPQTPAASPVQAPPLSPLSPAAQPEPYGAPQSALMKGLTNYFNGQRDAAGNPNATPPSMMSAVGQQFGGALDNSEAGGLINSVAGNAAGNGYGMQAFGSAAPSALAAPAYGGMTAIPAAGDAGLMTATPAAAGAAAGGADAAGAESTGLLGSI